MSWQIWQIAPSHSPRSPEGSSASSDSLPPISGAEAAEQVRFRLDLRRSLLMHRRLAVGFAMCGLFLAVVYLLGLWAVNTARSLVYIPPTPSAMIHNAMSLLLSFAFLGIAVAIVAHKSDPRVYIASDVERLMGFAPMAQLPDFSEVADEVANEHLMQLVAGIETALRDRRTRNCVFTGIGPGAGATTVALRVKELFDTLGRVAVVMDGTGPPLNSIVEEAEGQSADIVLTDTAPLTNSAETQDMARKADCTIVVIESGVTTRAQLRAAASVLERLDLPFAGFVLNRVRLAKADHAFRRSLEETEQDLHYEKLSAGQQTLRTLYSAVESGRASLELEGTMAAQRVEGSLAAIASTGTLLKELNPAAPTELTPQAESGVAAAPQKPEPTQCAVASPPDEIPWWLLEAPAYADAVPRQPRIPRAGPRQGISGSSVESRPPGETDKPVPKGSTHVTPARLSKLRGKFVSGGLKELDLERDAVTESAEAELLMRAIAPFEPLFNHTEPGHSSVPAYTLEVEAEHAAAARTFNPIPGPGYAPPVANEGSAHGNGSPQVANQREFHASRSVAPERNGAPHGGNGGHTRRAQGHATHDQGGASDDVQILPSKHGQYRKNDWEQRNGQR